VINDKVFILPENAFSERNIKAVDSFIEMLTNNAVERLQEMQDFDAAAEDIAKIISERLATYPDHDPHGVTRISFMTVFMGRVAAKLAMMNAVGKN
jgi:hypothetical protein